VAKDWRTLKLEVLAETTQFVKGMDKANATTKSFGDKLGDFAKKAGIALAAVGAAAGLMAIKIGKEAVAAASDLAETVSKVDVIFGDTAKNIETFGAKAAASSRPDQNSGDERRCYLSVYLVNQLDLLEKNLLPSQPNSLP
jgi:hypothetical protein